MARPSSTRRTRSSEATGRRLPRRGKPSLHRWHCQHLATSGQRLQDQGCPYQAHTRGRTMAEHASPDRQPRHGGRASSSPALKALTRLWCRARDSHWSMAPACSWGAGFDPATPVHNAPCREDLRQLPAGCRSASGRGRPTRKRDGVPCGRSRWMPFPASGHGQKCGYRAFGGTGGLSAREIASTDAYPGGMASVHDDGRLHRRSGRHGLRLASSRCRSAGRTASAPL